MFIDNINSIKIKKNLFFFKPEALKFISEFDFNGVDLSEQMAFFSKQLSEINTQYIPILRQSTLP